MRKRKKKCTLNRFEWGGFAKVKSVFYICADCTVASAFTLQKFKTVTGTLALLMLLSCGCCRFYCIRGCSKWSFGWWKSPTIDFKISCTRETRENLVDIAIILLRFGLNPRVMCIFLSHVAICILNCGRQRYIEH